MAKKIPNNANSNKPNEKKYINLNSKSLVEKHAFKLVVLIFIIGIILRIYRLGYLSLWVDEYMHAFAAQKGLFTHGENNGVLLTWINTTLSYIIGYSEFALRFPVAVLGSMLIFVIFSLGKEILNYRVGLIASIFICFSIYLIFWSRVDRPYGIVSIFYTLSLLYFWKILESEKIKNNFFSKLGINNKYIPLFFLFILLSFLSQLISFIIFFSFTFYGTFIVIDKIISKKDRSIKINAYLILFILNLLLIIFLFSPLSNIITRPILELFLPRSIATFILPNIDNIKGILKSENWDKCFNTYIGVINNDFKYFSILGWLGFFLSFFINRKLGYFLLSSFVIPFLLLSFIFTSTSHAKYLIQIYPIFLLSVSVTLYYFSFHILTKLNKNWNEKNKSYLNLTNISFIVFIIIVTPFKDISSMLNTEEHGNIVSSSLSEISYVDWKQPCNYINELRKKDDIIMATVQTAPKYYLNTDSVLWFRQNHLNPNWSLNSKNVEKYVPNKPDQRKNSAYTYEQLVKTYENNARGWLLADYYFDNALTDPKAKQFVEENFTYHFEGNSDGAVKVFSWDKANPKKYQSAFVYDLGKSDIQQASKDLYITMNNVGIQPKYTISVISQGIDSDVEAFLIINDKEQIAIKPNGKPTEVGMNVFQVDAKAFKNGENKIVFAYNNDDSNGDLNRGFVVFNMNIQ